MALTAYSMTQIRALKNMRIRSKDSEHRRRTKWEDLNVGYKERREERKAERRERHDSVPPLRKDSFRNVDSDTQRRSRSMSRTPGQDRAEVRPPRTPPMPPPVKASCVQLIEKTTEHTTSTTAGEGSSGTATAAIQVEQCTEV